MTPKVNPGQGADIADEVRVLAQQALDLTRQITELATRLAEPPPAHLEVVR